MRYYIIAGEASGDLHGSNLMKGLYKTDPRATIRFWGGPLMNAVYEASEEGDGFVKDYKDGAVMGITQIVLHACKYLRRLKECEKDIERFNPDAVILIDYPGFNFRVAEYAHRKGYKVFWYIAPKVWASRENRVRKLREHVDMLFIVFPFEKEYFDRKGIRYIYEGNPLTDAIDGSPGVSISREDFLREAGLEDRKFIALLAGSRKGEVSLMMPVLAEFADRMHAIPLYSDWQFVLAGAPSRSMADYEPWLKGREGWLKVVFGQTHAIVRHAQAAVVNSGTASLETCLIGTPQVVGYAMTPLNFTLAKLIMHSGYISLGNLILSRRAFKELVQNYFNADNLTVEVRRIMEDDAYRETMLSDYGQIRKSLGGSGASSKVAGAMYALLDKRLS
ncbi:MAG: lipid-A-disaccharide synthase [Bacteroidales bacterium]|nr:lipid-A-disaccharide synthase [Bacteroidales bacterium]